MIVIVNGAARDVADGTTLAVIVAALGRDPARPGVAVAVNSEVVARGEWPQRQLAEGDHVEVLVAAQGG